MDTATRSDSVASAGSTGATLEGYLLKRSGKKLVKWRKRWFTLRTEVLLYYPTERSLQSRGSMDLAECMGLRKHTEIRKIKNLPKYVQEQFVFGIATKKKVFVVCAPDIHSYNDWTWSLHTAITQSNPEVVQLSLGTFIGNRSDPFQWMAGDFEPNESDESSSEDEAFQTTREESNVDLRSIQRTKRPGSKQGSRSDSGTGTADRREERVRLVQTPNGLNFSNNKTVAEPRATSKWAPPRITLKDRFNAGTDWHDSSHSAPSTPVNSPKLPHAGFMGRRGVPPGADWKQKQKRSAPLGSVGSKMRSSISKLSVSGSMSDLRDILRPQSSLGERTEAHKGPALKRSASGNVADEEARAFGALQECLQEVEQFKEQMEQFLGREVLVEQDLTRMVEDRSLHENGFRRFKGLRDNFRSILQNLYKGLVSVAEPIYVRKEATRVLAKFQFTLYQIPFNPKSPQRPASTLMLQSLQGRALDWDCPDPPGDCCMHYYLQLQLDQGKRLLDIMTVCQCELFWENLLRGKESKFSLQIETGVAKWQMDLEKLLGRRIGMFVDTAELMRQVPEQTLRYKAAEGVGSNFCQESLGRLVGILEKLVDNQLTQKQLKKRLRYIELGSLPKESEADKVIEWRDGGLLVLAKWHDGVKIQYADVFQCFESENTFN